MASLRKVKHIKLNLSKRRAIGGHWSVPLIAACLTLVDIRNLCRIHGIPYSGKLNKEDNIKWFEHHYCSNCEAYYTIFKRDDRDKVKKDKSWERKAIYRQQPRVHHLNNNKTHQEKSQKKKSKEKLAKKNKQPSRLLCTLHFHHVLPQIIWYIVSFQAFAMIQIHHNLKKQVVLCVGNSHYCLSWRLLITLMYVIILW